LIAFLERPEPKGVKWKIIASSIPFTKNWRVNSLDTWAGYLNERQKILESMWDVGLRGGVGVVVISGDRHEFAATAFPPPAGSRWPVSATVHEFSTSPLSQFYLPTATYAQTDEEDVLVK
jgi:alkaline phosphatase D